MTDEPNERTDLSSTPNQPGERRVPQHRSDDSLEGDRIVNDDDAGSYTDVELEPSEVDENEGTGAINDGPDGEYTDTDPGAPGSTTR